MINDERLIRLVRSRGHKSDWPEAVWNMKQRILEQHLGFPGLGDPHLSILEFSKIQEGDLFIWDPYLESGERGDAAPTMYKLLPGNMGYVEGIGCGLDMDRDPSRTLIRWGDTVKLPDIDPMELVMRVDVKPSLITGGPGYYYFYKAYRDWRY